MEIWTDSNEITHVCFGDYTISGEVEFGLVLRTGPLTLTDEEGSRVLETFGPDIHRHREFLSALYEARSEGLASIHPYA